jgi:hypothetical protein
MLITNSTSSENWLNSWACRYTVRLIIGNGFCTRRNGGLVKAAISLDGVAGELYLQGAHLTAWQPPGDEIENAGNAEFGGKLRGLHRSFLSPEIIIAGCGASAP